VGGFKASGSLPGASLLPSAATAVYTCLFARNHNPAPCFGQQTGFLSAQKLAGHMRLRVVVAPY